MSLGRPLMISNPARTTTTGLPEAIDDNLLSNEIGVWNKQPEGIPSPMEGYIYLIKLYDILGQVLEQEGSEYATPIDRNPFTRGVVIDMQTLLGLDSTLTEWQNSLPGYLQYDLNMTKSSESEAFMSRLASSTRRSLEIQAKRLYQKYGHTFQLASRRCS